MNIKCSCGYKALAAEHLVNGTIRALLLCLYASVCGVEVGVREVCQGGIFVVPEKAVQLPGR